MVDITRKKIQNVALLQLSIFILSVGGIAAKKASKFNFASMGFLTYFALEIFIIGVYAVLWQQIIKKNDLSVAYSNKGSLIIWTFLWAVLFFQEKITLNNFWGAVLVIIGISMVFKDA